MVGVGAIPCLKVETWGTQVSCLVEMGWFMFVLPRPFSVEADERMGNPFVAEPKAGKDVPLAWWI
jgi:hypothetical protein